MRGHGDGEVPSLLSGNRHAVYYHALKTASLQLNHVSLVLFHALPPTAQTDAYLSLAQWSSRVSCTDSPPGLESLATTILRI